MQQDHLISTDATICFPSRAHKFLHLHETFEVGFGAMLVGAIFPESCKHEKHGLMQCNKLWCCNAVTYPTLKLKSFLLSEIQKIQTIKLTCGDYGIVIGAQSLGSIPWQVGQFHSVATAAVFLQSYCPGAKPQRRPPPLVARFAVIMYVSTTSYIANTADDDS